MKKIANLDEIPIGGSKLVMVDDIPIALFNINGRIIAWDNRCPHRGASLSDGIISEKTIQCKYHLWEFNVSNSCSVANRKIKIKTFTVSVRNKDVFLC